MSKPVLIDGFCGGGGAARGYADAGFRVVGVDKYPQPFYPYEFHRGDALEFIKANAHKAAAVHTSPPCHASSALGKGTNGNSDTYEQLIPETREVCDATGLPYVIENVQGAHMRRDLKLCGEMFGLGVIRPRYFELGDWHIVNPLPHCNNRHHRGRVRGWRHGIYYDGPYVAVYGDGGGKGDLREWQEAMGIDWIGDKKVMAQAIPPVYTEYVGRHLIQVI